MYLCFAGIGGIATVAFIRATLPAAAEQARSMARGARKHGVASTVAVAIFVGGMIVFGSTKNTAQTNNPPMQPLMLTHPGLLTNQASGTSVAGVAGLSPLQAVAAVAEDSHESTVPPITNAMTRVEKWWRRGAFNDGQIVRFDADWCFPYQNNHLQRVEVWASGAVYPSEKAPTPIAELATKLSLKPHDTEVFIGRTANNSYRVEWHNGHPNRAHDQFADASIELFRNGNVIVTEGGVSTMIPYVIPFAHNGFGQDDDWVRANFINAEEILAVGYANWVDEQVGFGKINGLYKFTASFEEAPPEPTQLVVGDYSVCVTNSGEYVFLLEKGTDYEFYTWPFDDTIGYYAQDDMADNAPILMSSWGEETSPGKWTIDGGWNWLYYPSVDYPGSCNWMPTLQGSPDVSHLGPNSFPMTFAAVLADYCGDVVPTFHWSASSEDIKFDNSNAQTTTVSYASLPSWRSLSMTVQANLGWYSLYSYLYPTYGTNETPQVSVSLCCQSVMFVNDDHRESRCYRITASVRSDVVTNGHLRVVHSGDTDPEFFSDKGVNRVQLLNQEFSDDNEFSANVYMSCLKCGRGNIIVECTMADGELIASTNSYRIIEPVCKLVTSDMDSSYDTYVNPARLVYGQSSIIRVGVEGGDFAANDVRWSVVGPATIRTNQWDLVVTPSSTNEPVAVCAAFNDDIEQPIIVLPTVAKRVIPVKGFVVSHPEDVNVDADAIRYMVDWANIVYRQVGVEFVVTNVIHNVGSEELWDLTFTKFIEDAGERRQVLSDEALSLLNTYTAGDCIEIYLVGGIKDCEAPSHGMRPAAVWTPMGIFVQNGCYTALPHELGHALGLSDCYDHVGTIELPALHEPVRAAQFSHKNQDFYGGAIGRGFYGKRDTRESVIKRLLMYGISCGGSDIPFGAIEAFPDFEAANPTEESVGVGCLYFHESNNEVFSQ